MNWEQIRQEISAHLQDEAFSPAFKEDMKRLVHKVTETLRSHSTEEAGKEGSTSE
ncbi:hypothetical protein AB0A70_06750 [Streptomyces morookaense]|uniref:hypothetical protein n=1 Tax=Streptomyces morookaense TaxID=1970 RepID=UPI0033F50BBB